MGNPSGRAVSKNVARNARDAATARASAQVELDRAREYDPKTYPKVSLADLHAASRWRLENQPLSRMVKCNRLLRGQPSCLVPRAAYKRRSWEGDASMAQL
jgi:hypothetical protein